VNWVKESSKDAETPRHCLAKLGNYYGLQSEGEMGKDSTMGSWSCGRVASPRSIVREMQPTSEPPHLSRQGTRKKCSSLPLPNHSSYAEAESSVMPKISVHLANAVHRILTTTVWIRMDRKETRIWVKEKKKN
jgi:hypothetical protein